MRAIEPQGPERVIWSHGNTSTGAPGYGVSMFGRNQITATSPCCGDRLDLSKTDWDKSVCRTCSMKWSAQAGDFILTQVFEMTEGEDWTHWLASVTGMRSDDFRVEFCE